MAFATDYSAVAMSEKVRRIPALLATLVLAVSLAAHGFGGPDLIVKSTTVTQGDIPLAVDMRMSGKCHGCAGTQKNSAPTACSAFCNGVFALPSAAVTLYVFPVERFNAASEPVVISHAIAPDPYPPRLAVLS